MLNRLASSVCVGIAFAGITYANPAGAVALFFDKVAVKTGSEATCLQFASDVARQEGFTNVHKSSAEVAGEKNGAYVAITCIGRANQEAIAVVMSVASDFNVAKQVGLMVATKLKGIVCFDSPC